MKKKTGNECTLWAVDPWRLGTIRAEREELKTSGLTAEGEKIDFNAAQSAKIGGNIGAGGNVAVLNITGPMEQFPTFEGWLFGYTSTEAVSAALRSLDARGDISSIILRIHSPGGVVMGTPELAAVIRDVASRRKVIAQVSSMAASAAYWIASQASEIVVSPSGQVGSIGVIAEHQDISAYLADLGVKPTLVTSSQFKAEGNPYEPLNDAALAEIQSKVDAYHKQFVADVAKGRGVSAKAVNETFGQGRMVLAADAVKLGMADKIGTLEETVARMAKKSGGAISSETDKPEEKASETPPTEPPPVKPAVTEAKTEVEKIEPEHVPFVAVSILTNRLKRLRADG